VLIPLVLARVPESRGPDAAVDLPGLALVSGGMFGIVWGLVRANLAGWTSGEVVVALGGGLAVLAAFVVFELRAQAPMLPMRFFRSRAFSAGNAAIFCAVASLFGAVFFMSQFLQSGLGYGPLDAGLRMLPWTATLFFVAPIAGKLVDRFGERPFLVIGPLLQAAGLVWIALIADASMSYGELIPPLMVAGVGISMSFPAAQNSVVSSVPPEAIGKAAGTNTTMRELGGVLGIAVAVAAFAGAGSYASPTQFTDGFVAAMSVASGLSILAALAGAALPARLVPSALAPVLEGGR
jgi:predicted MFS family arabinose efflux permease